MIELSSPENEKGLLCTLLSPEHGSAVLGICFSLAITSSHFHDPAHCRIYDTILTLHREEQPIDLITVTNRLRELGQLDSCGGAAYISELHCGHGLPSNARAYCASLDARRRVRAAISLATRINGECGEINGNLDEWLSGIAEEAAAIKAPVGSLKTPAQAAREFLDFYQQVETCAPMVACGLDAIDLQAGPFMRSDVVVISGVTGGGKSALVNSIIDKCIDLQQCAGVFTLEMSSIQYIERIAAARAGVNMHGVRQLLFKKQRVHPEVFAKIGDAVGQYAKSSIYIVDDVTHLDQLEARAMQINARRKLDIVVLDYAQLLSAHGDTREQEVANVSKGMKRIARKLDCVAIVLSQLNDDGRLRESRAIGHDANIVLNIERDDRSTWVRVSKGRSCASGTIIPLKWIPEFTKFENFAAAI